MALLSSTERCSKFLSENLRHSEFLSKFTSLEVENLMQASKNGFSSNSLILLQRLIDSFNLRLVEKEPSRYNAEEKMSIYKLFRESEGIDFERLKRFAAEKNSYKFEKTAEEKKAYAERIEFLKVKQMQRDYDKMVNNVSASNQHNSLSKGVAAEVGEIRKTMREVSVGFSMLLLAASVFAAGYFWIHKVMQRSQTDGLIAGLFLGIFMLLVEMILFIIRTTRQEDYDRLKAKSIANNAINTKVMLSKTKVANAAKIVKQL